MKKLLQLMSVFFAAVPGVGTLKMGFLTPPGDDYKLLFGWVLEVFGLVTVIMLYVNRRRLAGLSKSHITKLCVSCAVATLVLLLVYIFLLNYTVVKPTRAEWLEHGPVYFPLYLQGEIAAAEEQHGRVGLVNRYGPATVVDQLRQMPGSDLAYNLTSTGLLVLYTLVVMLLVLTFGVPGFHEEPT